MKTTGTSYFNAEDLEGCISSLEHYLLNRCTPVKRQTILDTLKPSEIKQLSRQFKELTAG